MRPRSSPSRPKNSTAAVYAEFLLLRPIATRTTHGELRDWAYTPGAAEVFDTPAWDAAMATRHDLRARLIDEVEPYLAHVLICATYLLIVVIAASVDGLLHRLFPEPPQLLGLTEATLQMFVWVIASLGGVHTTILLCHRAGSALLRAAKALTRAWKSFKKEWDVS